MRKFIQEMNIINNLHSFDRLIPENLRDKRMTNLTARHAMKMARSQELYGYVSVWHASYIRYEGIKNAYI